MQEHPHPDHQCQSHHPFNGTQCILLEDHAYPGHFNEEWSWSR